jgi:hypothetical protein
MTILESIPNAQKDYKESLVQEKLITYSNDKKYLGSKGLKLRYKDFAKQREITDALLTYLNSFL